VTGGDATEADARRPGRKLPQWLRQALQLFAFCGFAFAQPVFDLYRFRGSRTFASYLSPAPVLFAVLFLFASPVSGLLSSGEPTASPSSACRR